MRIHSLVIVVLAASAATFASIASRSVEAPADDAVAAVRAELVARATAFVDAFAREDAKALAEFWTTDGDLIDLNGRRLVGREAIAADFEAVFAANEGLALRIEIGSVSLPRADAAIEDGVTSVLAPDGGLPNRARYTNTWVRQEGVWRLASVREAAYSPPSHYEHLRPLEWLIGEWVQDTKDPHALHVSFAWASERNYILVDRTMLVGQAPLEVGSERIGWDPAAKSLRSWSFETDGGFGQSVWSRDGAVWRTSTSSVLASGSTLVSAGTITRVDENTITWQATSQAVDGRSIPDSPTVTMRRVR